MVIPMETIVLYSNGCQECDRVKMLLLSIGGEFLEYRLGVDFSQKNFESEFGVSAEYPQVAVGTKHIGGLKQTLNYLKTLDLI
tara:strand:- start:686 stop:934 length:249 start_codon:yes stop_codon:yes gene_type:complete